MRTKEGTITALTMKNGKTAQPIELKEDNSMKKMMALALVLILALSLAACGGRNDAPKPSGSADPGTPQQEQNTPDPGESPQEQEPDSDENQGDTPQQEQAGDADSMEALAEAFCLPGLTAPDGCTFARETIGVSGCIGFSKEDGFTSDEHKAVINEVWELCNEISPDGIYDVKNSGSTNTISDTYTAIADKYAEYDDATLSDYEIYWHYTYDGRVRQVKILGGNPIRVITADMGTLESQ